MFFWWSSMMACTVRQRSIERGGWKSRMKQHTHMHLYNLLCNVIISNISIYLLTCYGMISSPRAECPQLKSFADIYGEVPSKWNRLISLVLMRVVLAWSGCLLQEWRNRGCEMLWCHLMPVARTRVASSFDAMRGLGLCVDLFSHVLLVPPHVSFIHLPFLQKAKGMNFYIQTISNPFTMARRPSHLVDRFWWSKPWKPSHVTRQNGMLGSIFTSWFLFNSSSWVLNRVFPSVWRHQNTEVNVGKGWEISSEGWVLKIERPSNLKGQKWTKHSLPPTHHPFHCSCSPGSKLDQKKPGWPACPGGNSSVPERGAWTDQCLGRWSQRWGKAFWGKHAGTYVIRIIDHNSGQGVTLKSSLWPRAQKNSKKYRLAATGWNQNTNARRHGQLKSILCFFCFFFRAVWNHDATTLFRKPLQARL